jgi:hypothetical protein
MSTESITRSYLACPHCQRHDVARSRTRGILERLARLFGLKAFRCRDCYERFFSFGGRLRRDARPPHDSAHDSNGGVTRGAKVQT